MLADTRAARIEGVCDQARPQHYSGWLIDRADPFEPVAFSLLANGRALFTRIADRYRSDLDSPSFGDGRHAFDFAVPFEVLMGGSDRVELSIRIDATGETLDGSRRIVNLKRVSLTYQQLRVLPDSILDDRLKAGAARAAEVTIDRRGALPPRRRVALFAINARFITPSHRKILVELRKLGYAVAVINSDDRYGRLWHDVDNPLADAIVVKRNEGRDFSSWLTGYHLFRETLEQADHVLFVNESLCGPVRPLELVLAEAEASNSDFWALSDSYDQQYHLRSSFFVLKNFALLSRPFREFVAAYSYPDDKQDVIRSGEVGMSTCLLSGGISSSVLCSYEEMCSAWLGDYQAHLDEVAALNCFADTSGKFRDDRGGSVCLHRLAGMDKWIAAVGHAAARSGWLEYIRSGVRPPSAECGLTAL